jgi:hypothetical protein
MAIYDVMFEFSDNQDISQAVGSVASTDTLDFQAADREMGAGEPVWLNVQIGTAFAEVEGATTGACTLVVALCNDSVDPIDGSSTVLYQTRALTEPELTANAWILRMPLPVDVDSDRILGLYYTIAGATSAVGTINAWLDHGPQSSHDTQVCPSNV